MTQKEKELLMKDLCARLPYGFVVHRYSDNRDISFEAGELDDFAHFIEYSEGEEFKPYLRPMSSMTDEEYKELGFIITKQPLQAVHHIGLDAEVLDFYYKHHFDVRFLIPIGLALEATEDMYKK